MRHKNPLASYFDFLLWCRFGVLNILCFCDCNHTSENISMSQLQMKVQETVKRREQLLSYSGGHLHPVIKACRRKSIDLIGSFPGNSIKFGSIENNEGQGRRWRRQRRQQHSGQKHFENFSSLKLFAFNIHRAAVRPRTLLPVYCHTASKAWQS